MRRPHSIRLLAGIRATDWWTAVHSGSAMSVGGRGAIAVHQVWSLDGRSSVGHAVGCAARRCPTGRPIARNLFYGRFVRRSVISDIQVVNVTAGVAVAVLAGYTNELTGDTSHAITADPSDGGSFFVLLLNDDVSRWIASTKHTVNVCFYCDNDTQVVVMLVERKA